MTGEPPRSHAPDPDDEVHPPLTLVPDRELERRGELRCHRCGAPAMWTSWGDAWIPACAEHAPEDDRA